MSRNAQTFLTSCALHKKFIFFILPLLLFFLLPVENAYASFWGQTPAPGTMVGPRPTVSINTDTNLWGYNYSITIDGINYGTSYNGSSLITIPSSNLIIGTHTATASYVYGYSTWVSDG